MTKRMKKRLGWIVLVSFLVMVIIYFAIVLKGTKTKLAVAREELAELQSALDVAREQGQIEAFLRISVVSYAEGRRKEAVRFLEYAIYKMADRDCRDLSLLPTQMLKDPLIARKLGLKKGKLGDARRFGGG